MKIIGIDIGTTTISGVVLENKVEGQITTKAEEKLEIVEAKTIENGCFIPTEHEWERIQDAEQIVKKAQNLTDYFLDKYQDVERIGLTGRCMELCTLIRMENVSVRCIHGRMNEGIFIAKREILVVKKKMLMMKSEKRK